jgi:hypothetical protein
MHLFEWEDFGWFPRPIRRGITDILRSMATWFRVYNPIIPRIAGALRMAGHATIVDLCSGSGGPLPAMHAAIEAEVGRPVDIILTDLYPPADSAGPVESSGQGRVTFHPRPVDATNATVETPGVRTLFSSFHHFQPEKARAVLADAARRGCPIMIVEATERTIPALMYMLFMWLVVLVVTPAVRPFRWSRLFLTYLLPAIPLCITWDGLISALRTYSVTELEQMGREAAPNYRWEAGRIWPKGGARILFLLGTPDGQTQEGRLTHS